MRLPAPPALRDPLLLAILCVAALLLFWNLGGRFLWQDEAETALLAKSVLRTGLPIASDGTNVVSQEAGREFGSDFLWRWSPWIQFYLAAGSIALLGPTPLAARLPFALLGLLAIPATYALARRLVDSIAVARLSALFMALSVPFLLHARQARWHSPAYLLVIVLLLALERMGRGAPGAPASLVACATLLFYTNYFVAIGIVFALLASEVRFSAERRILARLGAALAVTGALCLPGVIFFGVLGRGEGYDPARMLEQLWAYLGSYLTFLVPLPMLVVAGMVAFTRPVSPAGEEPEPAAFGPGPRHHARRGRAALSLLVFSATYLLYLSLAPWMMFRYLSVLLPPASILLALGSVWILERSRAAGLTVATILVLTNLLQMTPLGFARTAGTGVADRFPSLGLVGSPLAGYLYEVTHRFDDPEAVLCRYLKDNALPGDVLLITYGDLPLQFCTGMKVAGGLQGRQPPADPEWIVVRHFALSADPGKDLDVARFIQAQIDPERYEAIDLQAGDSMLGNNPDPAFHLFRPPAGAPPLVLLRRKRGT